MNNILKKLIKNILSSRIKMNKDSYIGGGLIRKTSFQEGGILPLRLRRIKEMEDLKESVSVPEIKESDSAVNTKDRPYEPGKLNHLRNPDYKYEGDTFTNWKGIELPTQESFLYNKNITLNTPDGQITFNTSDVLDIEKGHYVGKNAKGETVIIKSKDLTLTAFQSQQERSVVTSQETVDRIIDNPKHPKNGELVKASYTTSVTWDETKGGLFGSDKNLDADRHHYQKGDGEVWYKIKSNIRPDVPNIGMMGHVKVEDIDSYNERLRYSMPDYDLEEELKKVGYK